MSAEQSIDRGLTPELASLLDGRHLASKVGQTFLLSTCDSDGWPRLALLSVGEVLALPTGQLRIATYSASQTTRRMAETRRCLLVFVVAGTVQKLRLEIDALDLPAEEGLPLRAFVGTVLSREEDRVGYATVVRGVEYELGDEETVLQRWRRQLAWLGQDR